MDTDIELTRWDDGTVIVRRAPWVAEVSTDLIRRSTDRLDWGVTVDDRGDDRYLLIGRPPTVTYRVVSTDHIRRVYVCRRAD